VLVWCVANERNYLPVRFVMKKKWDGIKRFLERSDIQLVTVGIFMVFAGQHLNGGNRPIGVAALMAASFVALFVILRCEDIDKLIPKVFPFTPKSGMDAMLQKDFKRARVGLFLVRILVTGLCIVAFGASFAQLGEWWWVQIGVGICSLLTGFVVVSIENLGKDVSYQLCKAADSPESA
jgi:hypothetical protein